MQQVIARHGSVHQGISGSAHSWRLPMQTRHTRISHLGTSAHAVKPRQPLAPSLAPITAATTRGRCSIPTQTTSSTETSLSATDSIITSLSSSMKNGNGAGSSASRAILLVQCLDQKGVIAALSQLLYGFGCNILSSDQFVDNAGSIFFQRIEFDFSEMVLGQANTPVLERAIAEVARRFNMTWKIAYRAKRKRLAVLVSKLDHCLYDLLIRHKSGELDCDIPVIISNHPDLGHIGDMFGVEFRTLSAGPGNVAPGGSPGGHATAASNKSAAAAAVKAAQEAEIEAIMQEKGVDMVVLARYMQIFSKNFCDRHAEHTINIHHSFLPAFEGAKPYHRAHERGVKIIGATAHYATAELDAGPIIEQQITRITHRDQVTDMIRKGRDLERLVLARAVRWHVEDRVLVWGNKTVVFED